MRTDRRWRQSREVEAGSTGEVVEFDDDSPIARQIQALAIVIGHVAGVLYAHDLAVTRFDQRDASRSQQTMLVVMVIYSVAGLWVLFSA